MRNTRKSLGWLLWGCTALLAAKVFVSLLTEYRWYFPPDFDSSLFLAGRQAGFRGVYPVAFFCHIIVGPVTLILATLLAIRTRFKNARLHRLLGRAQFIVVLGLLLPSGLVMATQAHAGVLAGLGLAGLALATAVAMLAAARHAWLRQFKLHQRWATRCLILLFSPLLLRVMIGATVILKLEANHLEALIAWLSWIVPLAIYELSLVLPMQGLTLTAEEPTVRRSGEQRFYRSRSTTT
ncbi:MAG: DUF2306 domain-containing protein [Planctomycetales bacterium]|nr:DUF2306 domain-containing protein [Planctomycetales bacterium]